MIEEASHSYFQGLGLSGWVPYIVSPIVTLLLGSYGLGPSAIRNLGLVALGEVVGYSVSYYNRVTIPRSLFATDEAVIDATTTTS